MCRPPAEIPAGSIQLEIVDGIAAITFATPEAANTITLEWAREFRDVCASIVAQGDAVRVITMSASGRFFCAGGDVALFASASDPRATLRALTDDLHEGLIRLQSLNAPTVAGVQGAAAGAGMSIVLGADLAVASESATFIAAYTGVGLSLDAGCSYWLPRRVGSRLATELLLTNRRVDAAEAARIGIVNEVVPDRQLQARVAELAAQLADGPTAAYGDIKRLLGSGSVSCSFERQLEAEAESIARLGEGPTGREGAAAFLAKRRPRFHDY